MADIHIVGGAVMVTEYDAGDATADIDAFDYRPHGAVEQAAALVADEMGLPRSWLIRHWLRPVRLGRAGMA